MIQCVQQGTGEAVSSRLCDTKLKPEHRRECVNLNCDLFQVEETQTISAIEEEIDEERTEDRL